MDIQLTAASIEHENREAEAGVSGQAEPELIQVQIFLAGDRERDDIAAFLTQHGVEHSRLPYKEFDLDAIGPGILPGYAGRPSQLWGNAANHTAIPKDEQRSQQPGRLV